MAFIKNYGLFWERELVRWGSKGPGNPGALIGYKANSSKPVDFRDQAGVYVLYDGADIPSLKVTYVGQVGRAKGDSLLGRLRNHTRDHLWNRWTRFSWFGVFAIGKGNKLVHTKVTKVIHPQLSDVVDHLEGVLITMLEPPKNKRGANWKATASPAVEFFQEDDGRRDVVAKLAAVQARLDELAEDS